MGTTRVVNAFMAFLVHTCGRAPDGMTEADVAGLGTVLGVLDRLEASPKLAGYAS
jgi:hypothetical protein